MKDPTKMTNGALATALEKAQARTSEAMDEVFLFGEPDDTLSKILTMRLPADHPAVRRFNKAYHARQALEGEARRRLGPDATLLVLSLRALPRTKAFRPKS